MSSNPPPRTRSSDLQATSRLGTARQSSLDSPTYTAPALDSLGDDDQDIAVLRASPQYVTQPPTLLKPKGLTGKISTLFRRDSVSNDMSSAQRPFSSEDADDEHSHNNMSGSEVSEQRIFYSSHNDDGSEDSYESRANTRRNNRKKKKKQQRMHQHSIASSDGRLSPSSAYYTDGSTTVGSSSFKQAQTIVRYRGFSTSIKSLFLDEPLVCAACGCFGLILSNRTEYLLQLRNERRGTQTNSSSQGSTTSKKLPSRIVAYGLVLTILLMFSTFVIFGFGTGNGLANDFQQGYDYNTYDDKYSSNAVTDDAAQGANDDQAQQGDDAANVDAADDAANVDAADDAAAGNDDGAANRLLKQQVQIGHPIHGVFKLRDTQECIWNPVWDFLSDEWYRGEQRPESSFSIGHRRQQQYYNEELEEERDMGSNIRVALLFTFLLFLGILGRRRRMRTRFYLVKSRAQEDHLFYASMNMGSSKRVKFEDTRENQYEGACSHTLCGCYPVDDVDKQEEEFIEEVEVLDAGIGRRKRKHFHEDIVARGFNCIMAFCCGAVCKCWVQCLSVCALAQEAREMRLLIPPRYQRIDFITHQPFHEYQKDVNNLRLGWMGRSELMRGVKPHWHALSRLSRYILLFSTLTVAAIVGTLLFNPLASFSWQDAVVLAATFLQSFLVLFIVHWIFHKSDLSLDAVVKFFATGFVIAVPAAFFFEGLLVNIVLLGAWSVYELLVASLGDSFTSWVFEHWRMIWIIGELFNAYVVAAITEELCKYYTFRSVEHPDLMFLTGLHMEEQRDMAVAGGLVNYPFSSHQVQETNKEINDDVSVASRRSLSSRSRRHKGSSHRGNALLTEADLNEFEDEEPDFRSYRQRAMAITTGMISVAVGLACAENFLYVFVLGGALGPDNNEEDHKGDILEAWIVLFFRSVFPIHALAAAMQSVNVIRKYVETADDNGHRIGVGRIILPAVILHGTFDAVLMGINVYVETAWDKYLEENDGNVGEDPPYNSIVLNAVAWMSITTIMLVGLIWYIVQHRRQTSRLVELEQDEKARLEEFQISRKKKSPRRGRSGSHSSLPIDEHEIV